MIPSLVTAQQEGASGGDAPDEAILAPSYDALPPLVIIGDRDAVYRLPGSGYYIPEEEVKANQYLNGNRMLSRVPGVYVREEDGFGNFSNISIRGGLGTRSEKVTLMEDGVPSAPAPYAAPGAYYSPNASRMSGIEVLKGSSQVAYGPHTTGGVVNYLSTLVPEDQQIFFRGTYGSYGTWQTQGHYGDVLETGAGRVGFLAEMFAKGSEGFRTIDAGNGFAGSGETGFTLYEPMFKMFWEPDTVLAQRFEVKYGYTNLDADETYVGLAEQDLLANPYRRYAGTYLDNVQTEHHRSYLKWIVQPTDALTLESTGYYNEFARNWYKIDRAGGAALHTLLANPAAFPLQYQILQMQAPGNLRIRANERSYTSYGYQLAGTLLFDTESIGHELDFGARYHNDQERRFQRNDTITVGGPGVVPLVTQGVPGSGDNRLQEAGAYSFWVQDTMTVGRFSVSPGVRYEYVDLSYTDFQPNPLNIVTASGGGTTEIWAPGMGFNYEVNDRSSLFGGVFKGISAPGPRNHIRTGVDWEESVGYELGLRHRRDGFYGEVAAFFTDFSNLTGSDTGLGGTDPANAGSAEVKGVEFLFRYDPLHGMALRMPMFLSATVTDARMGRALNASAGDNILAGGLPGAEIPYVPDFQGAAGIGLETDRWGVELSTTYVDDTLGTVQSFERPFNTARQGKIDEGFIADLAMHYQLREGVRLTGGVHNLFDQVLTASRIPEGPRSNAPRMFYVGMEMLWEPRWETTGKGVVTK